MARKKSGVNKSEEIRQLLASSPDMKAKEIVAALKAKGVNVSEGLVYFTMGKVRGGRGRKRKARKMIAAVAETTGRPDALATILKIKALANDVGGLKKLKALLDALTD